MDEREQGHPPAPAGGVVDPFHGWDGPVAGVDPAGRAVVDVGDGEGSPAPSGPVAPATAYDPDPVVESVVGHGRPSWVECSTGDPELDAARAELERRALTRRGSKVVAEQVIPAPEIPATLVNLDDFGMKNSAGAMQVRKKLVANGWSYHATFARGPWLTASGKMSKAAKAKDVASHESDDRPDTETEPQESLTMEGVADSIYLWAQKDGIRIRAGWIRRPWTKDPLSWKRLPSRIGVRGRGLVASSELDAFITGSDPSSEPEA
jgi:hypothetical protein